MRWRILSDVSGPINHWFDHPWEAELEMLNYGIRGFVQGFRLGERVTRARDWYRVDSP